MKKKFDVVVMQLQRPMKLNDIIRYNGQGHSRRQYNICKDGLAPNIYWGPVCIMIKEKRNDECVPKLISTYPFTGESEYYSSISFEFIQQWIDNPVTEISVECSASGDPTTINNEIFCTFIELPDTNAPVIDNNADYKQLRISPDIISSAVEYANNWANIKDAFIAGATSPVSELYYYEKFEQLFKSAYSDNRLVCADAFQHWYKNNKPKQ